MVVNLSALQKTQVGSLGGEDALQKDMAAHSSIVLNTILTAHMYSAALAL